MQTKETKNDKKKGFFSLFSNSNKNKAIINDDKPNVIKNENSNTVNNGLINRRDNSRPVNKFNVAWNFRKSSRSNWNDTFIKSSFKYIDGCIMKYFNETNIKSYPTTFDEYKNFRLALLTKNQDFDAAKVLKYNPSEMDRLQQNSCDFYSATFNSWQEKIADIYNNSSGNKIMDASMISMMRMLFENIQLSDGNSSIDVWEEFTRASKLNDEEGFENLLKYLNNSNVTKNIQTIFTKQKGNWNQFLQENIAKLNDGQMMNDEDLKSLFTTISSDGLKLYNDYKQTLAKQKGTREFIKKHENLYGEELCMILSNQRYLWDKFIEKNLKDLNNGQLMYDEDLKMLFTTISSDGLQLYDEYKQSLAKPKGTGAVIKKCGYLNDSLLLLLGNQRVLSDKNLNDLNNGQMVDK